MGRCASRPSCGCVLRNPARRPADNSEAAPLWNYLELNSGLSAKHERSSVAPTNRRRRYGLGNALGLFPVLPYIIGPVLASCRHFWASLNLGSTMTLLWWDAAVSKLKLKGAAGWGATGLSRSIAQNAQTLRATSCVIETCVTESHPSTSWRKKFFSRCAAVTSVAILWLILSLDSQHHRWTDYISRAGTRRRNVSAAYPPERTQIPPSSLSLCPSTNMVSS